MTSTQFDKFLKTKQLIAFGMGRGDAYALVFQLRDAGSWLSFYTRPASSDHSRTILQIDNPPASATAPMHDNNLNIYLQSITSTGHHKGHTDKVEKIDSRWVTNAYLQATVAARNIRNALAST